VCVKNLQKKYDFLQIRPVMSCRQNIRKEILLKYLKILLHRYRSENNLIQTIKIIMWDVQTGY